jgi:drug/metabolite transporter (DMT)-like permease
VDRKRDLQLGYVIGLGAAILFGLSAPLSKALLDGVGPQMLAGLLYLGAFLAVAPAQRLRRGRSREAHLHRSDLPRLGIVILAGGIVAPVLLMLGLQRTTGLTGSLLLNLEGPLTLIVGVLVLREHLGRRSGLGSVLIFGGAALLALQGSAGHFDGLGALCIVGACAGWAIDNNLTQTLTVRDPFAIVSVKTGVAAAANLGLAVALGSSFPGANFLLGALALGALAYGVSILLDAYALRMLGAARESAVFATAPFAGAVLAVPLLGDTWSVVEAAAAFVMIVGLVVVLRDRHEHRHLHEPLDHEHRHAHDEHHQHEHAAGVDANEPHSHVHHHDRLAHAHAHASDSHHRHPHGP